LLIAGVTLWVAAVGLGGRTMLRYANTPGRIATPPRDWPPDAEVQRTLGKPTLLLFVHPECPCSRASIEELSHVMVVQGVLEASVLFFAPSELDWRASDLYQSAKRIPGVHVISDKNGRIGRRFGAHTSGQAMYYNSRGRLEFVGGITAARGHVGDNDGVDTIFTLLKGGMPAHRTAPVFGCSLYGDN
jgi:hypothetical protein